MTDDEQRRARRKRAVLTIAMNEFVRTMSTPVVRLAAAINSDLYQALAYYEVFAPSGSDAKLIHRVTSAEIHYGFNVISESLQLGCILALCRLWDKPKGSAHIPAMARELQREQDIPCDQDLLCGPTALQAWLRDVKTVEQSEELKALRGFRHVGLAHRADPNRPDPRSEQDTRRVVHGDERAVLDRTIDLVDRLNALVGYPHESFRDLRIASQKWGGAFWDRVAQ